ncbi:MAG TPA: glycosyltransferase [Microbacterium sp.]|nr:glycosyltransferase [Microbacterium sp.]
MQSEAEDRRPTLLILSFSQIVSDARVLKQVALFRDDFAVFTCGFGPTPDGVVEHVRIPDGRRIEPRAPILLRARLYRAVYRRIPAVAWSRRALRGRMFDVVLADDYETVPLALGLARSGVHCDLHEYSSRLYEEVPAWRRLVAPFVRWIIRRYVRRAASVTTVGEGLAREYKREFGIRAEVVRNAAPYVEADVRPTGVPIRLVHSGAGLRARHLEETIAAVLRSRAAVTLDLYLTHNHPEYVEELRTLAASSGGRVTVHDPVPYEQLAATLRDYDIGVFVLRPVNFSYEWAMPNKVFDYIQARLGVIVGPSQEVAGFIRDLGVGVVTDGFAVEDIVRTLDALTPEGVDALKERSAAAARGVSAEEESVRWREAVDRILTGRSAARR